MTKQEFLNQLQQKLQKFGVRNTNDYIDYYAEYLDDLIENGHSETEAVERIGGVKKVLVDILSDEDVEIPNAKDKLRSGILIGTLPVWGPLLFALYLVPVAFILVFIVSMIGFGISGIWLFVGSFMVLFHSGLLYALFQFGIALVLIGLTLLSEQISLGLGNKLFGFNKYLFKKFNVKGI